MASTSPTETEKLFLSSVLRNRDMPVALKHGITEIMFRGYADEWRFITTYYQQHRKVPSKLIFQNTFPDFTFRPTNDTSFLAEELKSNYVKRSMVSNMKEAGELLRQGDVAGAVAIAHKGVLEAATVQGIWTDGDIFTNNQDILDVFEDTRDRTAESGSAGIPLGFNTFDDRTGGGKPGELVTIGARLGVGKSWFLQKWAATAAGMGYTVAYNSLEMSRAQCAARIYSMLAKEGGAFLSTTDLTMGKGYTKTELDTFLTQLKKNMQGTLRVSDRGKGGVTPLTIAAQIERLKPDIVFIDYIQLMKTQGPKTWDSIGEVTGELKQLATSYMIPIVIATQLNRERGITRKGEVAGAEAISASDVIGMDSDTIVNIAPFSDSVLSARCVKNRHGKGDFSWYVHFQPAEGKLRECSFEKANTLKNQDIEAKEALRDGVTDED